MMLGYLVRRIAVFCILCGGITSAEASTKSNSLTERFLKAHSLDAIRHSLAAEDIDISPFLTVFHQAIEQEKAGFFGYHATTLKHWVLNEIIKQVLRLHGDQGVPEQFYFLRTPVAHDEDIRDIQGFLSKCLEKRHRASTDEKKRYISLECLRLLDKDHLLYDATTADQVFEALLFFSPMKPNIAEDEARRCLEAFLGKEGVQSWLEKRFRRDVFAKYLETLTLEELQEHSCIYSPVADTVAWQQQLLVSLNFSLFGNYTIPTESTLHVFMKGHSIDENADQILECAAQEFLASYGFSKHLAKEIFEGIGAIENLQQGVLLQFFDDPQYSHLDQYTFVCNGFNSLYHGTHASDFIAGYSPANDEGQLRLLITKDVLDPRSTWLSVKQYDVVSPSKKQEIRRFISEKLTH